MKNVKYIILGIMISLLSVVIYGIVSYIYKINDTVTVSENEIYHELMQTNSEQIVKLNFYNLSKEDKECLYYTQDFYNKSLALNLKGEVNLNEAIKKLYSLESDAYPHYVDIYNSCNFTEEIEKNFRLAYLYFLGFDSQILKEQDFNYEIRFIDTIFRKIYFCVDGIFDFQYANYKVTEATIINEILEMLGDRYEENI